MDKLKGIIQHIAWAIVSAIATLCVLAMFVAHMLGLWDPVDGFKKPPAEQAEETEEPAMQIPAGKWRTTDVTGQAEVLHAWGRTDIVDVTAVTVEVDGEDIQVDIEFVQPTVLGKQQKGYFLPIMRGRLSTEFPPEIQVITNRSPVLSFADGAEYRKYGLRTAYVLMIDGVPLAVHFSEARFDESVYAWKTLAFHAAFTPEDSK